jgi:hypothetical protein
MVTNKKYERKIADFCKKIKNKNWYHYTDFVALEQYLKSKNKYIDNLKDLLTEKMATDTRNPNHTAKREISKIVFGTLAQSDAKSYNNHIS